MTTVSVASASDIKYIHFCIICDCQCFQKLMMAATQLHKAGGNDNSSLIVINQKSFIMSNLTELELLNADEIETLSDAKFLTNT